MSYRSRKLLLPLPPPPQNDDPITAPALQKPLSHANSPKSTPLPSGLSSNTSSPSSSPPLSTVISAAYAFINTTQDSSYDTTNSSGGGGSSVYDNYRLHPPFDTCLALTLLVLLTALFFMGFFSVFIRRFSHDSSLDLSRPQQRRIRSGGTPPHATRTAAPSSRRRGADQAVVRSLPVYAYDTDAKQGIVAAGGPLDCPICLSQFEERECVKVIPSCGHVFHVQCIDTWLSSHVTCPLCRTEEFFPPPPPAVGDDVVEEDERGI